MEWYWITLIVYGAGAFLNSAALTLIPSYAYNIERMFNAIDISVDWDGRGDAADHTGDIFMLSVLWPGIVALGVIAIIIVLCIKLVWLYIAGLSLLPSIPKSAPKLIAGPFIRMRNSYRAMKQRRE